MVAELTCREFQLKVSQPWSSVASLSSLKSSRVRVTCSPTSPLVYAPHTTGGPTHTRSSSLTRSQESRGAVRRRDCPVRSRRICHPGRSVLVRYGMRARGEYYKLAEEHVLLRIITGGLTRLPTGTNHPIPSHHQFD
jgi:hypothetical protein